MSLTQEQIKELKFQLSQQIQNLPEEKKQAAQQQIDSLSPDALEYMLKEQTSSGKSKQSIFRMIISGDISSTKIEENSSALAVLDINPISKGHTIVIPKKLCATSKEISPEAFALAQTIAERIEKILNASSVDIQTEKKFGEYIIHIIPSYEEPLTLQSERKESSKEDLEEIAKKIKPEVKEKKPLRVEKVEEKEPEYLPPKKRRIA
ncbi:MAG: HIT family protein [Nanoarchaeota archaeon]|nr:HIT family protein [Nanoarchaeota archaeon]